MRGGGAKKRHRVSPTSALPPSADPFVISRKSHIFIINKGENFSIFCLPLWETHAATPQFQYLPDGKEGNFAIFLIGSLVGARKSTFFPCFLPHDEFPGLLLLMRSCLPPYNLQLFPFPHLASPPTQKKLYQGGATSCDFPEKKKVRESN